MLCKTIRNGCVIWVSDSQQNLEIMTKLNKDDIIFFIKKTHTYYTKVLCSKGVGFIISESIEELM